MARSRQDKVVVIGAGAAGLSAAIDLAAHGASVTVIDRAGGPGGKMRQLSVDGAEVDAGPTVFTMKWIFDGLFADAGADFNASLAMSPLNVLARHAWRAGGRLDLFADRDRSADAIAAFASPEDAQGYRDFCTQSRAMFETLRDPFIADQRPSHLDVVRRVGLLGMPKFLAHIKPLTTLWRELARHFRDPRLRQLFGRYATYVGSSPFATPATIMLVAHVEQDGVWRLDGGMKALAGALEALGKRLGADYRYGVGAQRIETQGDNVVGVTLESGERLPADAVIFNGDVSALGAGLLGDAAQRGTRPTGRARRSLSAVTWCLNATTSGFPLAQHNVFFAEDYQREFESIFRERRITTTPTVYLCAADRGAVAPDGPERLLLLINAPADGDAPAAGDGGLSAESLERAERAAFDLLGACGLSIDPQATRLRTGPADFDRLFPATGGALYGQSVHGAMATLARAGAATRIKGLYCAGGSVHPGPGVPMAAMSGRLAAARYFADRSKR